MWLTRFLICISSAHILVHISEHLSIIHNNTCISYDRIDFDPVWYMDEKNLRVIIWNMNTKFAATFSPLYSMDLKCLQENGPCPHKTFLCCKAVTQKVQSVKIS